MCSGIILTLFQSKVEKQCEEQQLINADAARTAEPPQDALVETMAQYQARLQAAYNAVILGPRLDPTMDQVALAIQFAAGGVMPYKALEHQKCFMHCKMRKPAEMRI